MPQLAELSRSNLDLSYPLEQGVTLHRRVDPLVMRRVRDNLAWIGIQGLEPRDPDSYNKTRIPAVPLLSGRDSKTYHHRVVGVTLGEFAKEVDAKVPTHADVLDIHVGVAIPIIGGNRFVVLKPVDTDEDRLQRERLGVDMGIVSLSQGDPKHLSHRELDATVAYLDGYGGDDPLPENVRDPIFDAVHKALASPGGQMEITLHPVEANYTIY